MKMTETHEAFGQRRRLPTLSTWFLLALSALWLMLGFRITGVVMLTLVILLLPTANRSSRPRALIGAWAAFVIAMTSPLDISLRQVPGSVRVVPYVMGLPNRALRERAARGDVVLGGCVVHGLEPKWVVVW